MTDSKIDEALVVLDTDQEQIKRMRTNLRATVAKVQAINAQLQMHRARIDEMKNMRGNRRQIEKQKLKIEKLQQEREQILRESQKDFEKNLTSQQIDRIRNHIGKRRH